MSQDLPAETQPSDDQPLMGAFPPTTTADWEAQIRRDLRGADYEQLLHWRPEPGVDLRAYYRAEDLNGLAHLAGAREETGAIVPLPEARLWLIREDITASSPPEANRQARQAMMGGAEVLGFDLPDDPDGGAGPALATQSDFRTLLEGLPLGTTTLQFHNPATALFALGGWLNEAARQGIPAADLRGTVAADPITTLLLTGRLPADGFDVLAGLLPDLSTRAPGIRPLALDARPFHEAGASMAQELGFTLAAGRMYLTELTESGLSTDLIWRQMHVHVGVGPRFYLEVAKCRALRLLLRQVVAAYDSKAAARPAFVAGHTSRRRLTRLDPHVNLLRGTTEAVAAVVGQCDVVAVAPYDALLDGSEDGRRLARNTQLILRHEAFLGRVRDPGAGAYYLEQATDQLARAAWACFQMVEAAGGLVEAFNDGLIHHLIAQHHDDERAAILAGQEVLVGTNRYAAPQDLPASPPSTEPDRRIAPPQASPGIGPSVVPTLAQVRSALERGATLTQLRPAPHGPPSGQPLVPVRDADAFERIRLQATRFGAARGRPPVASLLAAGDPATRAQRATFMRELLGAAGFVVIEPDDLDEAADALARAVAAQADLIVLCADDETLPVLAEATAAAMATRGLQQPVVAAGYPKPSIDRLKQLGVARFIHRGSDRLETLTTLQSLAGIPGEAPASAG